MPFSKPESESDLADGKRFAQLAALVFAVVSLLPYIYGLLVAPVGQTYLGYQYNTDDHMVYSAWMRQAAEGRFFFDNRFAVDSQPGLTVHVYFLALGLLAKLTGLSLAAALGKAVFSGLFILVLYRFLLKLEANNFFVKLALSVAAVGGGLGFLLWHSFGEAIVKGFVAPLNASLKGLPTDVWQPEAFVFPSMLTNGLFMVSLCLIVGFFWCVLEAQKDWRPVPFGFVWLGLLMNIHSYDVLLIALVMAGFLTATIASRSFRWVWLARVAVMALGTVGPALWFWHVYQNDPVFQARAATDTFSPNFRQVFLGLVVMAGLALAGLYRGLPSESRLRRIGAVSLGIGLLALFVLAGATYEGYWMDRIGWGIAFVAALAVVALLSTPHPAWNLILSWAVVGVVAIYFPALFQRKLAMGLSIPWAVLAAGGLWRISANLERGTRNLVSALTILVLSATSIRWFLREGEFIRDDVSRTTVHPVFLTDDARRILSYLDEQSGRKVVLAMPGIPSPVAEDRFASPYLPDMNAIASGLTAAYTYAGHWSETPDYLTRRTQATRFFLANMSDEERRAMIREVGITHIIAPVPITYDKFYELTRLQMADVSGMGTVVVEGSQFRLIETQTP